MTTIETIELLFRGGSAGLCLLVMAHILSRRPIVRAAAFATLFMAGAGIYALLATPVIREQLGSAIIPFKTFAMMTPAFFWLFIWTLHDDELELKPWMAIPPLLIAGSYLICIPLPQSNLYSRLFQLTLTLGLMVHSVHIVRCCINDDLVPARRHLSRAIAWLVPTTALVIFVIEVIETLEWFPAFVHLGIAVAIFAVALAFALVVSRIHRGLFEEPQQKKSSHNNSADLAAADRIDLGRLRDLMEEGGYTSPGLTIGSLAQSLGIPEHRLRKLINQGLGYRNFASFLNDHRIEEAKRRLAEPELARQQITNLAFDLGYASLAPFNRAFKERTGVSPSEWREAALAERN